jgi:hypothetical protein
MLIVEDPIAIVKCRTAIQVLLCLSVMLDSLLCLTTSISFCTRWYNVIWTGEIFQKIGRDVQMLYLRIIRTPFYSTTIFWWKLIFLNDLSIRCMHRKEEIHFKTNTFTWIQQLCGLYHEEHLWNIQSPHYFSI